MEHTILWAGFFGAWLVFAAAVFQASVELRAEREETFRIESLSDLVTPPAPVSPWWWLLPPAHYLLARQRNARYRAQVVAALPVEQYAAMTAFFEKATGWVLLAGGGFLIAAKETYELAHGLDWPLGVFWGLLVGGVLGSVVFTAARLRSDAAELARRSPAVTTTAPSTQRGTSPTGSESHL